VFLIAVSIWLAEKGGSIPFLPEEPLHAVFSAYYLGLPYNLTEETYLPNTAGKVLAEKGNMTQEQRDFLISHTIPVD
jgi:hypothetical protein